MQVKIGKKVRWNFVVAKILCSLMAYLLHDLLSEIFFFSFFLLSMVAKCVYLGSHRLPVSWKQSGQENSDLLRILKSSVSV